MDTAAELLELSRHAILAGELLRLCTCHLVHYSLRHALAAPLIAGGLLLLAPDCWYYRGASGIAVTLVALAAKIAAEASGHATAWAGLAAEVRVAWPAHLFGAVSAAIFTAIKK